MNPALRQKFQAPPVSMTRNTTIASSKFSHYTTISAIDTKATLSTLHPRLVTQVYRTMNRFNGKHVLLRRIVSAGTTPHECQMVFEKLKHFRHPNLVPLQSITPTTEFVLGSDDVIVEHRLIRRAKSVMESFFAPRSGEQTALDVTEGLLWSIACQLVGLIRAFHDVHTPLRGLHISKLMFLDVTGRIYFTGLGLVDLVDNTAQSTEQLMKQDIANMGLVLWQLAMKTVANGQIVKQEAITQLLRAQRYSQSLANLISVCLDGNHQIEGLCRALGERLSMEVGHQEGNADFLFNECAKEVHNGRLMRLMIKLNFVIESDTPDFNDGAEAKYTLKLFSQYVFNQVDESNKPRLDWGHVFHTLNKLDIGSDDLIQLIDTASNMLQVISFRDIRTLLERTFEQLRLPGQEMSYSAIALLQSGGTAAANSAVTPPSIQQ